ncbi:MAG: Ni/Fe hydrogenase subunit alpha [Myxococcota bacterium]
MSEKSVTKTIKVDYLARVEGEGALHIVVKQGQVEDVQLKIFEPPRFFEAFLRGRQFTEAPDITARICGICPVAYQMSAVHALESLCGVRLEGPLRALRRLLYCGEWIESHVLHVHMLHAPDFLGFEDAIQLAKVHPAVVKRGLAIKKIGNEIVQAVGGREIHPINVKVGGFYRVPTRSELAPLREKLAWALEEAEAVARWSATLHFADFEQDYEFVALRHPDEYPFNEGRVVSNRGLDIPVTAYPEHFTEVHRPHSTALHSVLDGERSYFLGPLARWALNFDKLPARIQALAVALKVEPPVLNPFKSIVVRALETVFAFDEAIRIIDAYERPSEPAVPVEPRAGVGHAATEAPRGMLYHRYELADDGRILDARIIPPTSQNQGRIEQDLRAFVTPRWKLPKKELTWQCEQAVRNYDPCISCSTHFLNLTMDEH